MLISEFSAKSGRVTSKMHGLVWYNDTDTLQKCKCFCGVTQCFSEKNFLAHKHCFICTVVHKSIVCANIAKNSDSTGFSLLLLS